MARRPGTSPSRPLASTTALRATALPVLVVVAGLALMPGSMRGQEPTVPADTATPGARLPRDSTSPASSLDSARFFASPVLPARHWARDAARQLALLGLAPGSYDRGKGFVARRELALLFDSAVVRATRPEQAALAEAYRERFRDEFGDVLAAAATPGRPRLNGSWLGAGYERFTGRVASGVGYNNADDWTGTRPIPDTTGSLVAGSLSLTLPPALALTVEPELAGTTPRLRSAMLTTVLWGYLGAWAGRRSTSFGPGVDGGIVLSDGVALDGFGAYTAQPFRFPWIFRAMGPIQLESFFSKVYGGDRIRDPFFVAFRGSMTPHPRFTVALNRAAMFAGRGNLPITLRRMTFLFTGGTGHKEGSNNGGFANDVLSVDLTWRPPVETVWPTVLYIEWGMDDGAGMWHRAPGIVAGAEVIPAVTVPWLSLGVERASFGRSDSTGTINSIWYRNWSLRQGWADYGLPVGHPLAGVGNQWTVSATAAPFAAQVRLRAGAFLRDRRAESLLAPERVGRSRGGWVRGEVRVGRRVQLVEDAEVERGPGGWTTSAVRTMARVEF